MTTADEELYRAKFMAELAMRDPELAAIWSKDPAPQPVHPAYAEMRASFPVPGGPTAEQAEASRMDSARNWGGDQAPEYPRPREVPAGVGRNGTRHPPGSATRAGMRSTPWPGLAATTRTTAASRSPSTARSSTTRRTCRTPGTRLAGIRAWAAG